MSGLLDKLKNALSDNTGTVPTDSSDDAAPHGLKLLYVARTVPEADLLRQVLTEAGFALEYVPGASTGVFGTTGNAALYISPEQFRDAERFLHEYFAADGAAVE